MKKFFNTITAGNLSANSITTGNLSVPGTLTVTNITVNNLIQTTGSINITGFSNTIGTLVMNSAGNIGIGTTAPTTTLNINGKIAIGNNTSRTNGSLVQVGNMPRGDTKGNISIHNNGEARYHLYNDGGIAEWVVGQKNVSTHDLTFSKIVSGVELDYFNVSSAGYVYIPNKCSIGQGISTVATGTSILDVVGWSHFSYGTKDSTHYGNVQITLNDTDINNGISHIALIRAANIVTFLKINTSNQFIIQHGWSGGVYLGSSATSWTAVSDRTLKTAFQDIENPLSKLCNIKGTYYKLLTDTEQQQRRVGVIAQDVQAVLPEVVSVNGDGKLGVNYTELIPLLIESVKELKSQLDSALTRIAQLESGGNE